VGEGEERFDGRQHSVPARRRELAERVGELLEIAEGHLPEWLAGLQLKPFDVGTVRPLGVSRAAMQPDFNHLGIGVGPGRFREAGKTVEPHLICRLLSMYYQ
jgi:hypothetical protein